MSRRRATEAEELALAIGSIVVEDEPDAVPRNRAQRLALAGHVAPALRRGADVAAQRRVTVEARDGSVAGYTTVLEVQKALVAANEIEIQVLPDAAPVAVPCERCGLPIPPKPMGSWRPICAACRCVAATCAGFGDVPCAKPTPKGEYTPSRMARRHGEPWRCQACKARKQAADPRWQDAIRARSGDPENRARHARAMKKLAADPAWRARVNAVLQSPERREVMKASAVRQQRAHAGVDMDPQKAHKEDEGLERSHPPEAMSEPVKLQSRRKT